jgi:tripartite-type tricarboxylate transporter receptor subunit TctC
MILLRFVVSLFLSSTWLPAWAQDYPSRPINLIVGFAPGGGVDIVARQLAEQLSLQLGQRVIVVNLAGAGGNVAAAAVARAEPDGYTILAANLGILSVNPYLYENAGFNARTDFIHVARTVVTPLMMAVGKNSPAKSMAEFVQLAKDRPGALNYGSGGVGNVNHLAVELFASRTGIKLQHVPFRGSAPAINELIAGRIDLMIDGINILQPFAGSGDARALAVTSAEPTPAVPGVPSMSELGVKNFVVLGWQGLSLPVGTPPAIAARLESEIARALATPALRDRLASQGTFPAFQDRQEFAAFVGLEQERWRAIVRETGAKGN